jgi:hypothetical protein
MKDFLINQNQLQMLFNVLGEFPAKQVMQSLDMLRSLKEYVSSSIKQEELEKDKKSSTK